MCLGVWTDGTQSGRVLVERQGDIFIVGSRDRGVPHIEKVLRLRLQELRRVGAAYLEQFLDIDAQKRIMVKLWEDWQAEPATKTLARRVWQMASAARSTGRRGAANDKYHRTMRIPPLPLLLI